MRIGTVLLVTAVSVPAVVATGIVANRSVRGLAAGVASAEVVAEAPSVARAAAVEWYWALNGPVSADAGGELSVDREGAVFLAGSHGGLDLDRDGVVDLASRATVYPGARNPLFMKLARGPTGGRLTIQWARSPGTPADRAEARVQADGRGGAYVSGTFQETLAFEGGPTLRGAGGNDAFIARYDAEGSVVWARVFGGSGGGDVIYRLAADGESNLYAVGTGSGTFALDEHGAEFRSPAARASVLVSYDPEGVVRWARVFGEGAPLAFGVRVAPNGHVYVTGELAGAADFDGDGTADLAAPRDRDGFVARFDRDGALLGAWAMPIPAMPAFTPDGDVIMAGVMGGPLEKRYGPADFDGNGKSDIELKGGGPTGAWVARYSAEGALRWVRSYTLQEPADVEVRGNIIGLSGNYHGVRDLDEDGEAERTDHTVDPSLESDLAIMLLSAEDGRPVHVWVAPGPGNDWANSIAFLPETSSLLVTGAIQLTADLTGDGEDGEGWIVCENLGDLFVAQYRLPERPAERVDRRREAPQRISLDVSISELEGKLQARLAWSGATSDSIDVYRNGALVATVPNDGAYTDDISRGRASPPFRYRVCVAGSTACSATWQRSR